MAQGRAITEPLFHAKDLAEQAFRQSEYLDPQVRTLFEQAQGVATGGFVEPIEAARAIGTSGVFEEALEAARGVDRMPALVRGMKGELEGVRRGYSRLGIRGGQMGRAAERSVGRKWRDFIAEKELGARTTKAGLLSSLFGQKTGAEATRAGLLGNLRQAQLSGLTGLTSLGSQMRARDVDRLGGALTELSRGYAQREGMEAQREAGGGALAGAGGQLLGTLVGSALGPAGAAVGGSLGAGLTTGLSKKYPNVFKLPED
jgi:hypothetical protein